MVVTERTVILNESSKIVPGCAEAVQITFGAVANGVGNVTATILMPNPPSLPTSTLPPCIFVKKEGPAGPGGPCGPGTDAPPPPPQLAK